MPDSLPGNKVLRRMAYLRDQEGIMQRYLREAGGWEEHLRRSRKFIAESFSGMQGSGREQSVAILGSGWLLDLPMEALQERFERIYLVDIHHPAQVRKKLQSDRRVELLEADLSGGAIQQVWDFCRGKGGDLASLTGSLELSPPLRDIDPGAFVSLNLLSQLDTLLCEYLEKKGYPEGESMHAFRHKIQSFHLGWITGKPGCLISDVLEGTTDRQGRQESRELLHCPFPEGLRSEAWSWNFDSSGNYREGCSISMEVRAVEWA